jgi:hypothetical protein
MIFVLMSNNEGKEKILQKPFFLNGLDEKSAFQVDLLRP